mgnify:CR=1 FL=1
MMNVRIVALMALLNLLKKMKMDAIGQGLVQELGVAECLLKYVIHLQQELFLKWERNITSKNKLI